VEFEPNLVAILVSAAEGPLMDVHRIRMYRYSPAGPAIAAFPSCFPRRDPNKRYSSLWKKDVLPIGQWMLSIKLCPARLQSASRAHSDEPVWPLFCRKETIAVSALSVTAGNIAKVGGRNNRIAAHRNPPVVAAATAVAVAVAVAVAAYAACYRVA
jgi:hypothetical protein